MKKGYISKDFLPFKYIKEKDVETKKGERRGIVLLAILSLLLLPFALDSININKRDKIEKEEIEVKDNFLSKDSLLFWVDFNINGIKGNATNGKAVLYVEGREIIEDLGRNKNILINTINNMGQNNYRIEVVKR